MNSVRSNNVSLKYQRFEPSGCKDIGFENFEFVAKTKFLYSKHTFKTCLFFSIPLNKRIKLGLKNISQFFFAIQFS